MNEMLCPHCGRPVDAALAECPLCGGKLEPENEALYRQAKEHMDKNTVAGYSAAIRAFARIPGYRDAEALTAECKARGRALMEADKQEKERAVSEKAAQKKKSIRLAVSAAVIALCAAAVVVGFYFLNKAVIRPHTDYKNAQRLAAAGDTAGAIKAFAGMDHEDSAALRTDLEQTVIQGAKVGDTVYFGVTEQDGDESNGPEAIEWTVLEEANGEKLLLANNTLAVRPFNNIFADVTWEDCDLRPWLNGDFITDTFCEGEQKLIAESMLTTADNPSSGKDSGADTVDKVFLLSAEEAEQYLTSPEMWFAPITDAIDPGDAFTDEDDVNARWWLRTAGEEAYQIAGVHYDGTMLISGNYCNYRLEGVRPALRIKG